MKSKGPDLSEQGEALLQRYRFWTLYFIHAPSAERVAPIFHYAHLEYVFRLVRALCERAIHRTCDLRSSHPRSRTLDLRAVWRIHRHLGRIAQSGTYSCRLRRVLLVARPEMGGLGRAFLARRKLFGSRTLCGRRRRDAAPPPWGRRRDSRLALPARDDQHPRLHERNRGRH